MSVSASFSRAENELKKAFQTRKVGPSLADAFIALILSVLQRIKMTFFYTYDYIYRKLNHFLPLPFIPKPQERPVKATKPKPKPKPEPKPKPKPEPKPEPKLKPKPKE
jgi:hypothetical protein